MESIEQNSQSQFENRRKLLFDSLNSAEKTIKGTSLEQPEQDYKKELKRPMVVEKGNKLTVRKFRGRESIFKRPEAPISQCLKARHRPDHQVNPHKWTKYSLEDVDTSDHTNTSAAFSFLNDCEKRKQAYSELSNDEDKDTMDSDDRNLAFKKSKFSFNKSIKLRSEVEAHTSPEEDDKAILKGSKLVMPEYVIGSSSKTKKDKKKKSSSSTKQSSGKELKLDHLFDEEEDGI